MSVSRFRTVVMAAALAAACARACKCATQGIRPAPRQAAEGAARAGYRFPVWRAEGRTRRRAAKAVEGRIWSLWLVSKSDTTNLLMTQRAGSGRGEESRSCGEAARFCGGAETRLRRGLEPARDDSFMRKDYTRSIEDIRQVLAREPRHFGVLAGLGIIMEELGDDKRALRSICKAVEINPQMQRIPDLIKSLTEKVEGRDI